MISVDQEHDVPASTRARAAIDAQYVDRFRVDLSSATPGSARTWAEAVTGVAGIGGQVIWRGILQLNLGPAGGQVRIAGWNVGDAHPDWIRLEGSSWAITAHLVLELADDSLTVTTLIRYDRPVGRLIWERLAPIHRALMPKLLRGTVSSRRDPAPHPRQR